MSTGPHRNGRWTACSHFKTNETAYAWNTKGRSLSETCLLLFRLGKAELEKRYSRLPSHNESATLRRIKEDLAKRLVALDDAIKAYSKPKVFIHLDPLRPMSFSFFEYAQWTQSDCSVSPSTNWELFIQTDQSIKNKLKSIKVIPRASACLSFAFSGDLRLLLLHIWGHSIAIWCSWFSCEHSCNSIGSKQVVQLSKSDRLQTATD